MELKKILYSLVCIGGFAVAFIGLRVIGNALVGIGGIMVCMYGLLEAMHLFTDPSKKKTSSANDAFTPTNCHHCGAEVPAGNEFCGKCGNRI